MARLRIVLLNRFIWGEQECFGIRRSFAGPAKRLTVRVAALSGRTKRPPQEQGPSTPNLNILDAWTDGVKVYVQNCNQFKVPESLPKNQELWSKVRQEMTKGRAYRVLVFNAVLLGAVFAWPQRTDEQAMHASKGWSELRSSMEKMHAEVAPLKSSGEADADFARVMLPHHWAALEMARTELLYGNDPQLRRLAQEIITDQQSEIQLMELWLKQHQAQK